MGKVYDGIDESIQRFIEQQQMFFVATAPLAKTGHVNVSPKGLDSFRILDRNTVAYADLTGSGIETVSHVKENGRIVLMFCSFEGTPNIVRLHGTGEVIEPSHEDFDNISKHFAEFMGLRSFVRIRCHRVSDSCGWGVPEYEFKTDRTQLIAWAKTKKTDGIKQYQQDTNRTSIDGLPGIES